MIGRILAADFLSAEPSRTTVDPRFYEHGF